MMSNGSKMRQDMAYAALQACKLPTDETLSGKEIGIMGHTKQITFTQPNRCLKQPVTDR